MKRKIFSVLFALVLVLTLSLVAATPVAAADITVGPSGDHTTIQAAIDAANSGDTISVASGTYAENVVVDKDLTLQGVTGATIAPATDVGVEIQSSDVTVDGFDITTSGLDAHGIWISVGATGITLTGNDITIGGGSTAIYADAGPSQSTKSSGWLIQGNTLSAPAGCNLELYDVDDVTIDSNVFGNTLGSNVIVSSELFNLTGPIVFTNNDVQGNDGGSMVAFVTDFQQYVTDTRDDGLDTTMNDVTITGNTFNGWAARGLRIGDWGGDVTNVVVNYNNFLGTGEALANKSGVEVDAQYNWWSDATGPFHATTHTEGLGSEVSDDVDYDPWLGSPYNPSTVDMTAASEPAVIGISVDPTSVDFGTLIPGESSDAVPITVTNIGTVAEDFSATLANISSPDVYTTGLTIAAVSVDTWEALNVASGTAKTPDPSLVLTVPVGTPAGTHTAVLIFWAEMATP